MENKLVQLFHVSRIHTKTDKQGKFIDCVFFRQKEAEALRERMEREKRELQEFIGKTLKIINRVFFSIFFCTKILSKNVMYVSNSKTKIVKEK